MSYKINDWMVITRWLVATPHDRNLVSREVAWLQSEDKQKSLWVSYFTRFTHEDRIIVNGVFIFPLWGVAPFSGYCPLGLDLSKSSELKVWDVSVNRAILIATADWLRLSNDLGVAEEGETQRPESSIF